MRKLIATIQKESWVLLNDKVGLLVLFLMPIFLVFVITIVQDSTFRLVAENQISILVINDDNGVQGDSLVKVLKQSGAFRLTVKKGLNSSEIKSSLLDDNQLIGIYLPANFSNQLTQKAKKVSGIMLAEFGAIDSIQSQQPKTGLISGELTLYYDPVLQENYRFSLSNAIQSYLGVLENKLMIQTLYTEMGFDAVPSELSNLLLENRTQIKQVAASKSQSDKIPNSTQHNIPAWSIFAMFFMVVSLGGNLVKERLSGTFVRLQTVPASFLYVLWGKLVVYLAVAVAQLAVIFSIGIFIFPLIDLPKLELPENIISLIVIALLSALSAICYALLIGTYAKTQDQANGFGSVSIIIFAAIGGIWVPSFVMPGYLQAIGQISPLHWCLEGFYALFLQEGSWSEIQPAVLFLSSFSLICLLLIGIKLKFQKIN